MKKSWKKFTLVSLSTMMLTTTMSTCMVFAEGDENSPTEDVKKDENKNDQNKENEQDGIVLKQVYAAPHGDKSFASVVVVLQDNKILDAFIDEFQFVDAGDWKGVPNGEGAFAEAFAEDKTLVSKREDSESYSKLMAEIAGSTISITDNFNAIENFTKGKTIEELTDAIKQLNDLGEDGNVADVISGATLIDAGGYLEAIIKAVNEGHEFVGTETLKNSEIDIKHGLAGPHGDKAFALITVVMDEDKVAASTIDEFQTVEGEGWSGVPNMDGAFAEGLKEGKILISKLDDSETYSKLMAEKAGSTISYIDNLKAISQFTIGKTIDELSETVSDIEDQGDDANIADVISGATLVDAGGYLQAIVDVANQ